MTQAKHIARPSPYANNDDFHRIFEEDMNGLYLLSFLLTADREKAEQCFVSGLEDAVAGNQVFREWARSWARRTIILNAVRAIHPRPVEDGGRWRSAAVDSAGTALPDGHQVEIAAVLGLEPFERFVCVMTVLERYSDQECSVLLGCARGDVLAARTRALRQSGIAVELYRRRLADAGAETPVFDEQRSSALELLVAPRLATPA